MRRLQGTGNTWTGHVHQQLIKTPATEKLPHLDYWTALSQLEKMGWSRSNSLLLKGTVSSNLSNNVATTPVLEPTRTIYPYTTAQPPSGDMPRGKQGRNLQTFNIPSGLKQILTTITPKRRASTKSKTAVVSPISSPVGLLTRSTFQITSSIFSVSSYHPRRGAGS